MDYGDVKKGLKCCIEAKCNDECPYKKLDNKFYLDDKNRMSERCFRKMMQNALETIKMYEVMTLSMNKIIDELEERIKPNDSDVASEAGNSGFEDSERGERK